MRRIAPSGVMPSTTRPSSVTKDEDFENMLAMGGDTPAVVWVRVGNTRRTPLLAWLEPLIDQIVSKVRDGERLIELR